MYGRCVLSRSSCWAVPGSSRGAMRGSGLVALALLARRWSPTASASAHRIVVMFGIFLAMLTAAEVGVALGPRSTTAVPTYPADPTPPLLVERWRFAEADPTSAGFGEQVGDR